MRAAALLVLVFASPVGAQPAVTSAGPERVQVTVYRDLNRGNQRPNPHWLNGYALITETRTVALPAGASDLRFESVASGIIPQSTIVSGLPKGIVERNRDALLLSAGSLIHRSLGQRVTLRRTDRATGKVTEQQALVRSGSDGGVVLQTPEGFEALRCSGLAETLTFPQVPPGLSPRPTLSVRVQSAEPVTATIRLSYLATGFDWQADYVGILSADERTLRLQAWLTLASTDDTSFRDATTQAVAGRVNREAADVPPVDGPPIRLSCWPQGSTSDAAQALADGSPPPPPPPPPPPSAPAMMAERSEIIVTGSRVMSERERLGELQLYRIPVPVTVAANAQKQVGLLDQPSVKVHPVHLFTFVASDESVEEQGRLVLRSRNRESEGLGLPLPAGNVVILQSGADRPILMGEGPMIDTAVGEKVEIRLGSPGGVRARLTSTDRQRRTVTLTNDRPLPAAAAVELIRDDGQRIEGTGLVRRDGKLLWEVTVPANGTASLTYRLRS